MTEQTLYFRVSPGVTSCCRAMAAVEIHRASGAQDTYCAACLGGITATGHIRRFPLIMPWPRDPTGPPYVCELCGQPAVSLRPGFGWRCSGCAAPSVEVQPTSPATADRPREEKSLLLAVLAWILAGRPKG